MRDVTDEDLCATCAHLKCGEKQGYPNAAPSFWHAQSDCALDFPVSRVDMNVITGCPAYASQPLPLPALSPEDKATRLVELEQAWRAQVYAGNAFGPCEIPPALTSSQKVL